MATIGPVTLNVAIKGKSANVDVTYTITWSATDQKSNQTYFEECRLMGDDTGVGDPASAGPDDTLGFLTPLFNNHTRSDGKPTLERHFTKKFRTAQLDEDRGSVPNPDELRARVVLKKTTGTAKPVTRESNLVKKTIG